MGQTIIYRFWYFLSYSIWREIY